MTDNIIANPQETTTNFIHGDKTIHFSSSENKWINKVQKYAEEYPDEVKITYANEDGSILAEIPVKWFKISPPKKVSEEFKQKASERFQKMWADKKEESVDKAIDDINHKYSPMLDKLANS